MSTSGENGRSTEDLSADATTTVATILAEVRDTAPMASHEQVAEMIRTRLEGAEIDLPDSEVDELASQLVEGRD